MVGNLGLAGDSGGALGGGGGRVADAFRIARDRRAECRGGHGDCGCAFEVTAAWAFDGCALERSTYGETVVRWKAGFRATGAGFRGAGIRVARRAAGRDSRAKRWRIGVRTEKTRH